MWISLVCWIIESYFAVRVAIDARLFQIAFQAILLAAAAAVGLSWLAATHPILTGAIVLVLVALSVLLIWKLWGLFRRAFAKLAGPAPAPSGGP